MEVGPARRVVQPEAFRQGYFARSRLPEALRQGPFARGPPETAPKMHFSLQSGKRNRNEIQAKKKIRFLSPRETEKETENEKENENENQGKKKEKTEK